MKNKISVLILAVFICVCFYIPTAYAEGYEVSNDCGFFETTSKQGHEHCYNDTDTIHHDDRDDPAGVGADVVVWQNDTDKLTFIEEVVAEYRYDINNEEHSIFGVVRINLWEKIKGLFSRGE